MFEQVIPPSDAMIDQAVAALQAHGAMAFRIEPGEPGVFLVLTAEPGHRVGFVAATPTGPNESWLPTPMTAPDYQRLTRFTAALIPRLYQRWKAHYPQGRS